jgi:glyoxylase-like metal-dependent hydrolase (beta-lactamase superfamily II)
MIRQYLPNLWFVEVPLDGYDSNVRGAVLEGIEKIVIFDTLTRPSDMEPVLPLIGDKQIVVVYSHADWDHAWGTGALHVNEIIGHKVCKERFANELPGTLHEFNLSKPGTWSEVILIPPTVVFDHHLTVDLGGMKLELEHIPGHTGDAIIGFIPEWGILLGGDVIEDPFPMLYDGKSLTRWIDGLRRWANDPRVQVVVPAHGDIRGVELLKNNIAYLEGLKDGSSPLPENLGKFYAEAHQMNLENAKSNL